MTNILDGLAVIIDPLIEEKKCEYKPEATDWKANLKGCGQKLGDNLGNKPNAKKESELTNSDWPSQAHHLIPHKTLIDHELADWLVESNGELYADTNYDVDHENNGKWMPYASDLEEWKSTNSSTVKRDLMFKIMKLSNIQLHQGPHSKKNSYNQGMWPYKDRVQQYLDKISTNSESHYDGEFPCKDCSGKKQAGKYPPRANNVRYVDGASRRLNGDINACRIFVSRISAEFDECVGFEKS